MRFYRLVALLLVPCLLSDPVSAAGFAGCCGASPALPHTSLFTSQALQQPSLVFPRLMRMTPYVSRQLQKWWRENGRTKANAFRFEARHGLLFQLLIIAGAAVGNFFVRLTQGDVFDVALQMFLTWAPGTYSLWRLMKRNPETPVESPRRIPPARVGLAKFLQTYPVASLLALGLFTQILVISNIALHETLSANALVNFRPLFLVVIGYTWFHERHGIWMRLLIFVPAVASSVMLWVLLPTMTGWQWALPLASVVSTTAFYVLQKWLIDKQGIPVPPRRLTLYSGLINSTVALLWFVSDSIIKLGGHWAWPTLTWVAVPVLAGYILLSVFTVRVRYDRGTGIFQRNPVSRTSSADFSSEAIHAMVYALLTVMLGVFGVGAAMQHPPMGLFTVVALLLGLLSTAAALAFTDFKQQDTRDERKDLLITFKRWGPAIAIGGGFHGDFSEETYAAIKRLLEKIKAAGLSVRLRGLSPFTARIQQIIRDMGGLTSQAVWHVRMFLHELENTFDGILHLRHNYMRQVGFLMGTRAQYFLPGGLRTLDDAFASWSHGLQPTLIEVPAADPFWPLIVESLQQAWKNTGQPIASAPRIVTLAELDVEEISKLPARPTLSLTAEDVRKANEELRTGLQRMAGWPAPVVFRGDPHKGTASYEAALQTAELLFKWGVAVRLENRGDLYQAIWQEARTRQKKDLVQLVIHVDAGQTDPDFDSGPDQTINVTDLYNEEVFLTSKSLAVYFCPGPLPTIRSLFQLLAYRVKNRKAPAQGLIGRNEFWGNIIATLQKQPARIIDPRIFGHVPPLDGIQEIEAHLRSLLGDRRGNGPWNRTGNGGTPIFSMPWLTGRGRRRDLTERAA